MLRNFTPRLAKDMLDWRLYDGQVGSLSGKAADWPQLRERVVSLYRQALVQAAAALLSIGILVMTMISVAPPVQVLLWSLLPLSFQVLRLGATAAHQQARLKLGVRDWENIFLGLTLPGAAALGGAVAYFMTVAPMQYQVVLLAVVAPAAGAAIILSSASFLAAALTLVPLLGIPAATLTLLPESVAWLDSLLWLVLALLLWVSWQLEQQGMALAEASRQCATLEANLAAQAYLTGRSRDALHSALEGVRTGVAVFDRALRLVAWNDLYASLYPDHADALEEGAPVEGLLRAFSRLLGHTQEQEDNFIDGLMARLREDDSLHMEFTLSDGRIIEASGQHSRDGGWVFTVNDLTLQRKATAEALIHVSRHDSLTGLPNRATVRRALERAVISASRSGGLVAVMMINIGGFRTINDGLGATAGDAVLVEVARILRQHCQKNDILGRLGSDEFTIVSTSARTAADVEAHAQAIVAALREPMEAHGRLLTIGVAIGLTVYPQDQSSPDELLRNASAALMRAKAREKNAVVVFDNDMQVEMRARSAMEADIRANIDSHQFMFQYQPQIDLKTRQLLGVEALLRWHHPVRGWVSPDKFIAVAELSRLIIPLTEAMIPEVCMQARTWDARGLPPFKIAINLSPIHIRKGGFDSFFEKALASHGLKPGRFEFEITESVMMTDSAEAMATLHRLEALGVSLAIDDFGTGYSSISYLRRFPVSKLKIDRSFISEVTTDPGARAIVEAVTRLGHSFGQMVIAEGAETEDQIAALEAIGCDAVQGYYFARPMEANALSRWVEERYMHDSVPLKRVANG